MTSRENPIYGRKVFFINPPFTIEKKIVDLLRNLEYEVYIIKDYTQAKAILKHYENAICFVNIDEYLTLRGWFNYLKSFSEDPELKSIFLGIVATKTGPAQVNKFLMNLTLPGGYIQLTESTDVLLKKFQGILEINGAKGSRKFVSVNCDDVNILNGYIAYGNKLYSMNVENVSSIGITCAIEKDLSMILKKNTILTNVSLSLGRWSVITQCVVLDIKTLNGKIIAILIFVKETPKEIKNSLRSFIFDVLTKRMDLLAKEATLDTEDYNTSKKYDSGNDIPDYDAPTDSDDEVKDAEEMEEVEADVKTTDTNKTKVETSENENSTKETLETKTEDTKPQDSEQKEPSEDKKSE